MDVKQLRYFLGVLKAGSLSKAASQLHVAQPALGVQIRHLEQELGVELFQRHSRGVVPTKAGELLAERAVFLLHEFSRVRHEMINFAAMPIGRVSLGMTSTVAQVVVAKFVERCRQKFPQVRLVIATVGGSELIDKVVRHEVDLGLAFRPQDSDEIISEALIHDELVLVRSERLSNEVDFREIVAEELILPSEKHLVRRMVKRAAMAIGRELNVFYDADSVPMIKELVKRGLGPTIMPLTAIHEEVQEGKLFSARIKNADLTRTLFLLKPTHEVPTRSIDLVRDELRALIWEFADAGTVGWVRAKQAPLQAIAEADDEDGRELHAVEAAAPKLESRRPPTNGSGRRNGAVEREYRTGK